MANQIQATVYQIDGNPLPSPIVISFLTSDILMRRNAISTIPEVSSSITYYPNTSNQLQEQTFFVSEDLRVLRDAANTNGTTQVPTIILEIDGDPLVSAIGFLFPANGVSIWPSVNAATGVNSFIEFKNKRYSAAETEAELTAQANVNNALPYRVYTALLTQSGGDNLQFLNSGPVTKGVTYQIDGSDPTADFTNVGAPNNNLNTSFVAINDEVPNSYGGGDLRYNTGAPVVTVLENTIGNIWFTYGSKGIYIAQSDNLYIDSKSFVIIGNPTWDGGRGFIQSGFDGTSTCIISTSQNFVDGPSDCALLINTPIEIRVYN